VFVQGAIPALKLLDKSIGQSALHIPGLPKGCTMPRANASSDPSKLIVPRGSILSIVLFTGRYVCKNKTEAKRALMHGLTLGVSVDMSKDIKGEWVVNLSQMGVHLLRQRHGWKNPCMVKRNRKGIRRQPLDIRHPKVKVRAQTVITDWVPGEARTSDYTESEVEKFVYGQELEHLVLPLPEDEDECTVEGQDDVCSLFFSKRTTGEDGTE